MKLFVWHNILQNHTCGVIFAYASSVKEAREVVLRDCDDWMRSIIEHETTEADPEIVETAKGFYLYGGG